MNAETQFDSRNYEALKLFTDGRFSEAAKEFTLSEYRCASLFNNGDRAGLVRETASYDRSLYLTAARGFGYSPLIRWIASSGLSAKSPAIHPWFLATLKPSTKLSPRRIADFIIVPARAEDHSDPCFVCEQLSIDQLIISRNYTDALKAVDNSFSIWGNHPRVLLDQFRIWRRIDRERAYRLAWDLCDMFPNFFPGLTSLLEETIERLRLEQYVSAPEIEKLIQLCEFGETIDPQDMLVEIAKGALTTVSKGFGHGLIQLKSISIAKTSSYFRQRDMLKLIQAQYLELSPAEGINR